MSQYVTNAGVRRVSMLQFAVLFSLTLGLALFVLLRSCALGPEVDANKLALLKEKEPILQGLANLGSRLRAFEQAQKANSPDVPQHIDAVDREAARLYSMLAGKDTLRNFQDVSRILGMATYYSALVKNMRQDMGPLQTQLQILTSDKERLTQENERCQQDKKDCEQQLRNKEKEVLRLEIQLSRCKD